jgi:hypothetical protein
MGPSAVPMEGGLVFSGTAICYLSDAGCFHVHPISPAVSEYRNEDGDEVEERAGCCFRCSGA